MDQRWFLHVEGLTVGPLSTQEVCAGIASKEFASHNRACSSANAEWRNLEEWQPFSSLLSSKSGAKNLRALPSPRLLRIKPPPVPTRLPDPEPVVEVKAEIEPVQKTAPIAEAKPKEKPEENPAAKSTAAPIVQALSEELIPARPAYEPARIPFSPFPEIEKEEESQPSRIPLKAIALGIFLLSAIALAMALHGPNKTRDLKDSHLSDPSSPTLALPEAGDPTPPLKAPTRPLRE